MTSNYGYIKILPGQLKLLTITLAGIIMAMSYSAYFLSDYTHNRDQHRDKFTDNELRSLWRELYLMGVSTVCFILSSLNLWLYCHSVEFYWKTRNAIYDFLYHSFAALLLATSGILFIVSGVKIFQFNCTGENGCQLFELKLGAGGLAMLTSVIFGAVGSVILTNRKDVEREALMADKKSNSI
ncbi:uncharacterized protein LOC110852364 [Folsomia candida]|uniref:MARVEL domain-containing protein n=1 Tax=Folsomia candida TaxID=158441 RepID=A0A226E302_FOLCA|nr:uncharacterized protein LOC110852364 [Folsomia candida]XP_021956108.1 uncharacterized protein LOC110852364 [Folsomia candida]OXA52112.1 hypothetical protein Fcan01_13211 [Folsomia candida]